jgi:hypothetical protein
MGFDLFLEKAFFKFFYSKIPPSNPPFSPVRPAVQLPDLARNASSTIHSQPSHVPTLGSLMYIYSQLEPKPLFLVTYGAPYIGIKPEKGCKPPYIGNRHAK